MQVDYNVQLDLVRPHYACIETKQYDDEGRRIVITVTNSGDEITIPSGSVFTFSVSKPDKTFVKGSCQMVTISGKQYPCIVLTRNMLAVAGREKIDITLTQGGQNVSTMVLENYVRPAAVQDEDIESTTEYGALETALQKAEQIITETGELQRTVDEAVESSAASAGAAAESARSAAEESSNAEQSAQNAENSRNSAERSAGEAEQSANEAETFKDEAKEYRNQAAGYAGAASYSFLVDEEGYICLNYKPDSEG